MQARNKRPPNTILVGPAGCGAGCGATMRARQIAEQMRLAVAPVDVDYAYRAAGMERYAPTSGDVPFRAPHHTASLKALTGELLGHCWRPGEMSLAHGGVLFLDDLADWSRDALETVAHAVRDQAIELSNAGGRNRLVVPADFVLVGHALPCPCGTRGWARAVKMCACTDETIARYADRWAPTRDLCEVVTLDMPQRTRSREVSR